MGAIMSAKTKILVFRKREIIYTGIIAVLSLILIVMLFRLLLPGSDAELSDLAQAKAIYIPGKYSTELVLGANSINVEVILDESTITSIRMVNLSDAVATMYPLLKPTFEDLCHQVYELQSLEGVVYSPDSKYTSLVLLEAIRNCLEKGTVPEDLPNVN